MKADAEAEQSARRPAGVRDAELRNVTEQHALAASQRDRIVVVEHCGERPLETKIMTSRAGSSSISRRAARVEDEEHRAERAIRAGRQIEHVDPLRVGVQGMVFGGT